MISSKDSNIKKLLHYELLKKKNMSDIFPIMLYHLSECNMDVIA